MSISSETSRSSLCSNNSSYDERHDFMYFEDFYDLSIFLYKGQFGDYYRCTDRETTDKYMVKIIKPLKHSKRSDTFTLQSEGRFSREGAIWRRMKHRNIVDFIRIFKSSKEQFLVTEYIKDGNLFDQISQYTTYTERDVRHFGKQLLEALVYLRYKRVVHRNITADSILLKHNGNGDVLKICDFTLSLRLEKHQKSVNTEAYGVPMYSSPEALREKPVSCQVDTWSVGMIIQILLTGQPLFWSEKLQELYSKILTHDISSTLHYLGRNITKEAKELVSGLLEKSPDKRLTPEQALKHDWFNENLRSFHLQETIKKIHEFNICRKSSGIVPTLFTVQKIHNNKEQRHQQRKSDLITSSFGEKRRAKQYEHERQKDFKMAVVSKAKVFDLNNNTKAKSIVSVLITPRNAPVGFLASDYDDEGVDL